MGVDLATYRARIGTFISRRNVSCDDETRSKRKVNTKQFGKKVYKAMHLRLIIIREMSSALSQSLDITMYTENVRTGYLHPKIQHGSHRKVHLCLVRTARRSSPAGVTSFTSIKQKLLILSGDVEVNPGPLGQRTQDPLDCQCTHEHIYTIASLDFNLMVVAKRLVGPQLAKDIIDKVELTDQEKRDEVFEIWLKVKGLNATYKELVNLFETLKYTETANAVRMLVTVNTQSDDSPQESLPKSAGESNCSALPRVTRKEGEEWSKGGAEERKEDNFSNVSRDQLGEDDLVDVIKEVVDVAAQWRSLGLALRLKVAELDTVSLKNHTDPRECLKDILLAWLQQHYDIKKFGPPSWMMLCQAISEPAGGNNPALARKIADHHIGGAPHNPAPSTIPPAAQDTTRPLYTP